MEKKKQKLDNRGLTLVELLVTIALVAVVGGVITAFVITAQKQYNQGIAETDLQYEAQLLSNQFQELLLDANEGISYRYGGTRTEGANNNVPVGNFILNDAGVAEGATVTNKELYIYETATYSVLTWDSVKKEVYYREYDSATKQPITAEPELMAEFVSGISVDLSDLEESGILRYDLYFLKEGTGREYSTSHKLKIRNTVLVNKSPDEVYP